MNKLLLNSGIIICMLSVIFGAFGAHSLQNLVNERSISIFQTGVRYQFYHGLALLFCTIYYKNYQKQFINIAGILFIAGVLFFSGSLYLLSLKNVIQIPTQIVGPLTPIGGVLFIVGWIILLIGSIKISDV